MRLRLVRRRRSRWSPRWRWSCWSTRGRMCCSFRRRCCWIRRCRCWRRSRRRRTCRCTGCALTFRSSGTRVRHRPHRLAVRHGPHSRPRLRCRHFAHIHELYIKDQIGFGWNARVCSAWSGSSARPVRKLPWDEQASFSANLHAGKPLVKSGNHATESLRKAYRLTLTHLGLAISIHFRLAVFSHHRHFVIVRRIEFVSPGRQPAGVVHFVDFIGLSDSTCSDANILVAQAEGRLQNSTRWRHAGGQRHSRSGRRRLGCRPGSSGLGRRLRQAHARRSRHKKAQNELFHCEEVLRFVLIGSVTGRPSPASNRSKSRNLMRAL